MTYIYIPGRECTHTPSHTYVLCITDKIHAQIPRQAALCSWEGKVICWLAHLMKSCLVRHLSDGGAPCEWITKQTMNVELDTRVQGHSSVGR